MMPTVPPALLAMAAAAEAGNFPSDHRVRWVKSGAAPLAPDLARRFTEATGILICQGYGMTEASPVTHLGYLEPELYKATSIGQPMCQTDCRVVGDNGEDLEAGQPGELVMRGPQFMLGYWKEPRATEAVLRDGWYWSGDVVTRDSDDFYFVVDRRKELIKYKGFSIAPAEVEAVLLECPAVRDCGVVGCKDEANEEIPIAFVVARDDVPAAQCSEAAITGFVAERLTHYKTPRAIRFVNAIPKTASGKILRRELRKLV
jgi:acyl-CoA synthetase (AMP-forming)/AMP-acid ligase II